MLRNYIKNKIKDRSTLEIEETTCNNTASPNHQNRLNSSQCAFNRTNYFKTIKLNEVTYDEPDLRQRSLEYTRDLTQSRAQPSRPMKGEKGPSKYFTESHGDLSLSYRKWTKDAKVYVDNYSMTIDSEKADPRE